MCEQTKFFCYAVHKMRVVKFSFCGKMEEVKNDLDTCQQQLADLFIIEATV